MNCFLKNFIKCINFPLILLLIVQVESEPKLKNRLYAETTLPASTVTATRIEDITYKSFQQGSLFGLKTQDDVYCLLAKFEGRLVIRKLGKLQVPNGELIEPIGSEMTISGSCAMTTERRAELKTIWGSKGEKYVLDLYFNTEKVENPKKGTIEWKWRLFDAKLKYFPPDGTQNDTVVASMTSRSPIFAPFMQSFYCKHSLNITLSNVGNATPADVTVQFKAQMQLQPYQVESSGEFANTFLCERSREIGIMERLRSNTTILAGCILGFVAVAIIIGYTAKRYFLTERQSYTTMD